MLDALQRLPLDPLFQLLADYQADERPQKVNLGIGIYADSEGKPFVFKAVQEAVAQLDTNNFNYQPIRGNAAFLEGVLETFLPSADLSGTALQATCGGTHACRIYADLLLREAKQADQQPPKLLVGNPTWGNHYAVFAGLNIIRFAHLDDQGRVHVAAYRQALEEAEPGSVLLLHGGGTHNPSGLNLSLEDLDELIPLMREKSLSVFVDWAYAGMGLGLESDKAWVRKLWDGLEDVAVGISFSKNASLYEHRCGALLVKTEHPEVIGSHLQQLSREMISMAPGFGQEIMSTIFVHHKQSWLEELEAVRQQIDERRNALIGQLPEAFAGLAQTQGMFGLLPLSPEQIETLKNDQAVYLPGNGRINFGGLRTADLDRVAAALSSI